MLTIRYIPEGHPAIFDITKRKIHNVLQGVSPEGVEMNDDDKKWFEAWTEQNCEQRFLCPDNKSLSFGRPAGRQTDVEMRGNLTYRRDFLAGWGARCGFDRH